MGRATYQSSQPTVLFLGGLDGPDRDWTALVSGKARELGYRRVIEPCCGSFVISHLHRTMGWRPEQIESSDVSLFSAIVGYACTDQDLEQLEFRVDGQPISMTGDKILDASRMIYEQCLARVRAKPDIYYWQSIAHHLVLTAEQQVQRIAGSLRSLREQINGISFRPLDMMEHLAEVRDDPRTLVHVSPPTYKAGYEKMFDTKGRITWKEPQYTILDPKVFQRDLSQAAQSWKCLLICLQEDPPGHGQDYVVYAREVSRDKHLYFWTNRPEEVARITGKTALARKGAGIGTKLQYPTLPPDYDVTEQSELSVRLLTEAEAKYYKELWIHKIHPKPAGSNFALFVDGMLAGIAGYDCRTVLRPVFESQFIDDAVIYTYGTGSPHNTFRLTRLVTMVASNRETVAAVTPAMAAVQAARLVTIEFTKYPEAKGNRGLMKLVSRSRDSKRGNKLTYACEIVDRSMPDTLKLWLKKEREWRKTRKQNAEGTTSATTSS